MAKAKGPSNGGNKPGLDYYEYKRMHEMDRLRQRAVEVAGDVERKEHRVAQEAALPKAEQATQIFGKLLGGKRRQGDAPEELAREHVMVQVEQDLDEGESVLGEVLAEAQAEAPAAEPKPGSRRAKKAEAEPAPEDEDHEAYKRPAHKAKPAHDDAESAEADHEEAPHKRSHHKAVVHEEAAADTPVEADHEEAPHKRRSHKAAEAHEDVEHDEHAQTDHEAAPHKRSHHKAVEHDDAEHDEEPAEADHEEAPHKRRAARKKAAEDEAKVHQADEEPVEQPAPAAVQAPVEVADEGDADVEELEIMNPFASTFDRLKQIGKFFAKKPAAASTGGADDEEDEDDEDDTVHFAVNRHQRYQVRAKRPREEDLDDEYDEDEDDDDDVRRGPRGGEDPLGVIKPLDDETQRAYMRPERRSDRRDNPVQEPALQDDGEEDDDMKDKRLAELTARLADGMESSTPALSRKERKAMAAAGSLSVASKPTVRTASAQAEPLGVDEPTQQFKPLRARQIDAGKKAKVLDDDYDDDDEDDEDEVPTRRRFGFGRRKEKRRDYDDEDEYDEDEYDEDEDYDDDDYDDDDEYEDDYDDDEDYDDYDEIEEYERRRGQSGGKRMLGSLKVLLVVVIVLLLFIAGIRQLEASRLISLDGLRNGLGKVIPINWLFPAPAGTQTAMPDVQDADIDDGAEENLDDGDLEDTDLDAGEDELYDGSEDLSGEVSDGTEDADTDDEISFDPGVEGNPIDEPDTLPQTPTEADPANEAVL